MLRRCPFLLTFCISGISLAFSQTVQLPVSKVATMPDLPSPYIMRNWKNIAVRYDSFAYDLNATGQYLPLIHIKSSGINYPALQPILLDSYVGNGGNQAEAINIIPSLVGATLNGIDKSNQNGVNWVEKAKDFFNKANGQNVYLNSYSAGSGSDWWYDLMPNVFFYQLYSLYPNTTDFAAQFTTVADRQLQVVNALGGNTAPWTVPNLDYRGFNLSTLQPNPNGVTEPESAGTIAWILYHAYQQTGNKKYLDGAQLAITFLNNYKADPAYEIQLPYGTFIAAKMNAELGTTYNIQKMASWSFDQSSKRNWGTIVGTWGDATTGPTDVSGLVGEVDNPSTGYAFTLNGYQQASALVPMTKYDKRFAHDIAKWALNLANASRLFYSPFLPSNHQDDYAWTSVHDPNGLIGYESLKQINNNNTKNQNTLLYATGDNERGGGNTNLGIYGSSSIGYLGAIVNTTDVDGILLLDVNKTDFFGQNSFPSYLVFNPYSSIKSVTVPLGAGNFDIYDAISETTIKTAVSGSVLIDIPASGVRLLSYLPAGTVTTPLNGKLMAGNKVVDYSYGYNFTGQLRIRSLAAPDTLVGFTQNVKVYSTVQNKKGPLTFSWFVKGTQIATSADSTLSWIVPSVAGPTYLVLSVTDGTSTVKDSLLFNVIPKIPVPPVVTGITTDSLYYYVGTRATFVCHAKGSLTAGFTYQWTPDPAGTVVSIKDSVMIWTVPAKEGLYSITCKVTNTDGVSASVSRYVLVKIASISTTGPAAYYSFDGDTKDHSGNGHDATASGVVLTTDVRNIPNTAYAFRLPTDIIDVPNTSSLDFQNQVTLAFWVKPTQVTEECYIISHGSYEERYKVSITDTQYLRWTIKTSFGTTDLDGSSPLQLNKFYHITVVYTGYTMEIYVNGKLDSYTPMTGLLGNTSKDITFGRKDVTITNYQLVGTLDEVRIYSSALEPNEIATLKTLFNPVTGLEPSRHVAVYPNPARGEFFITGIESPDAQVVLMDMTGRKIAVSQDYENGTVHVTYGASAPGVMILKIETGSTVIFQRIIGL